MPSSNTLDAMLAQKTAVVSEDLGAVRKASSASPIHHSLFIILILS
jgi:hypothetical protein